MNYTMMHGSTDIKFRNLMLIAFKQFVASVSVVGILAEFIIRCLIISQKH